MAFDVRSRFDDGKRERVVGCGKALPATWQVAQPHDDIGGAWNRCIQKTYTQYIYIERDDTRDGESGKTMDDDGIFTALDRGFTLAVSPHAIEREVVHRAMTRAACVDRRDVGSERVPIGSTRR